MSKTDFNQTNQMRLPETLLQMITGAWVTQAIYAAAKLGIPDLLKDGAKSSEELAESTGVDPQSLYRVLRALSSVGIFSEGENRQFQLTPLAEYLQSDFPGSMRALAIFQGEPWNMQVWADILYSVKTGKTAFEHVHGMGAFPYAMKHPEAAQSFNSAMTSFSESVIPVVLGNYDFSSISKIVDVGGGHGLLIAEILKANPTMNGILFDQPPVVQGARHLLEAKGVATRCEIVGGSFFESIPSGGDAYIIKNAIHNWDTERALTILRNCNRAMAENSKLLVLESVVPPANKPAHSKWLDLSMLLAVGGTERTETEYGELLAAAGFKLTKVTYTYGSIDIIEAVKL